jgi:hypothetical protein
MIIPNDLLGATQSDPKRLNLETAFWPGNLQRRSDATGAGTLLVAFFEQEAAALGKY